tara:strand:+ start:1196 stop:1645 length:450 start_codon:yes stop_codon:yes gene_type:complete
MVGSKTRANFAASSNAPGDANPTPSTVACAIAHTNGTIQGSTIARVTLHLGAITINAHGATCGASVTKLKHRSAVGSTPCTALTGSNARGTTIETPVRLRVHRPRITVRSPRDARAVVVFIVVLAVAVVIVIVIISLAASTILRPDPPR